MGTGTFDAPQSFGPDLVLIEKLASGGMAEVFRARQTGAGGFERTVAIKRILPHFASDEEFKAMFESEVALSARLQQSNIVQVFNTGSFDGYLYLVMEFIHGQTIAKTMVAAQKKKQFLPPPFAAYVISEAAKGLDYAHRHQVVHRDVSPQNVMVGFDGQVKVVDFGIAKAADRAELTAPGQIKGKIAYMSPEQIHGLQLDGRSDVFALGVVLWEMLTRKRLFKAENAAAISQRVLTMQVRAPSLDQPTIHPELDAIVLKALQRDLNRRHQSALELHEELNSFLARRYAGYLYPDVAKFMTELFEEHLVEEAEHVASAHASLPTVTPSHGHQRVPEDRTQAEGHTVADRRPPSMTGATPPDDQTQYSRTTPSLSMPITAVPPAEPARPKWVWAVLPLILAGGLYVYLRPSQVPAHLPTDLPGLVAWFKASTLGTPAGETVSEWSDAGPMRIPAQQETAVHRPRFYPASDGDPAFVRFDGKDDFLKADSVAGALRRAKGFTAIWLVRLRRAQKQYVWSVHGEDRIRDVLRGGFNESSAARTKLDPKWGANYNDAPDPTPLNVFQMFALVVSEERATMYVGGAEVLNAPMAHAPRLLDSTYFSIGQEWDDVGPTDFFAGDVVELIVFDRSLYDEERRSLERYLSETYGVEAR